MNLTDLHMFKSEKDKIIATFKAFFCLFVFFNLSIAASELHPLGTPNDVCTALDTPTKWVSLFLFFLSISSCCIGLSFLTFAMVYKCHWFLSIQSPKTTYALNRREGDHLTLSGFQTHPWVHSTPFMIYITTGYQRSPSVENVSWAWMSVFFSRLQRGWIKA